MDKLVTYYQPVPDFFGDAHQVLELWNWSWSSWGWRPHVVGLEVAKRHRWFADLVEKVAGWPTLNNKEYELACYVRWCAASVCAPCWFGDFDVLNFGVWPFQPTSALSLAVRADMNGTVWGEPKDFDRCISALLDYSPKPEDQFQGKPHVSDYLVFSRTPNLWPQHDPKEICINSPGWELYPIVHYPGISQPKKKSRLEWMVSARPGWARPLLSYQV